MSLQERRKVTWKGNTSSSATDRRTGWSCGKATASDRKADWWSGKYLYCFLKRQNINWPTGRPTSQKAVPKGKILAGKLADRRAKRLCRKAKLQSDNLVSILNSVILTHPLLDYSLFYLSNVINLVLECVWCCLFHSQVTPPQTSVARRFEPVPSLEKWGGYCVLFCKWQ